MTSFTPFPDWLQALPISVRAKRIVLQEGCKSLDDMAARTRRDWRWIPGCGPETLREIEDVLRGPRSTKPQDALDRIPPALERIAAALERLARHLGAPPP